MCQIPDSDIEILELLSNPCYLMCSLMAESFGCRKLRMVLTNRILKFLLEQSKKDKDKYLTFYEDYGMFVREGIVTTMEQDPRVGVTSTCLPVKYLYWCHIRAGRSSEVERSLMVRWVVGSILYGVDPLSYFSFQPVLHDWFNKGCGMCYPVCGMVHIKEPLLLIDKSSLCGGSRFPFLLSEWSLTICLTPYNRR